MVRKKTKLRILKLRLYRKTGMTDYQVLSFRTFTGSLSHRAWTPEEQRRLEELLKFYPPEPVEMRRFHKIAKALGNRTVQQVSSRVQKYFLKLYKAGLPIPGRIPKSAEKYKVGLVWFKRIASVTGQSCRNTPSTSTSATITTSLNQRLFSRG